MHLIGVLKERLGDPTAISREIRFPLSTWPGNCFAVATAIVDAKIVSGRATYGHWTGPISARSFFKSRRGVGFCRHGWIDAGGGIVVDPTRWVFEATRPYIFVGSDPTEGCEQYFDDAGTCDQCGCVQEEHPWPYDEGGNRLLSAMMRPPPKPEKNALRFRRKEAAEVTAWLVSTLHDPAAAAGLTREQCFWLANLPLNVLGDFAKTIYQRLKFHDMLAYVPIDNQRSILGGH